MPTTLTRDVLLDPAFERILELWQVETLDAVLAGLRARGLIPCEIQTFPSPQGWHIRIRYYTDVASQSRMAGRWMELTWAA